MKWIRRGLIIKPTGDLEIITHATLPFVDRISGYLYSP